MTRFNVQAVDATLTTNPAGGAAHTVSPELDLYLRACSSFLTDGHYEKAEGFVAAMIDTARKCDRAFVLALAGYARNVMHLRSVPVLLLTCAATMGGKEAKPEVRKVVPLVVRRADELAEVAACYKGAFSPDGRLTKFPNALRRGLADAVANFDAYDLGKYRGDGKAVTLKALLRGLHPRPADKARSELYRQVRDDELRSTDTWEVEISGKGSTAETWNAVAPKMGFMALLRNLRNFEEKGAQEALAIACAKLTNPEAVRKSRQLPFRFLSAYQNVTSNQARVAVQKALDLSVANVDDLPGRTVVVVDLSGSMTNATLSDKSSLRLKEVASLMGAIAAKKSSDATVIGFAERAAVIQVNPMDSVMTNAERIEAVNVGGATYAHRVFEGMLAENIRADRVILLSDMQCYEDGGNGRALNAYWAKYRQGNPEAVLYSVNLAGYGDAQFRQTEKSVALLSGWSDRIFSLIRFSERGQSGLDDVRAWATGKGLTI